jgi:DNA-binding transcriptional LysR family regulator
MSDLDDIRAFVEVAETGGFGRAARRLELSKSIVSRRIARLEEALGTRLLSRTTRGIALTEAGYEFKVRGERILLDLEEARDAVAQHRDEVIGRLRLSVPLSFGVRHIAPMLSELVRRHPKLEIEASYSDRFVDLVAERFDAAVRMGELRDSSLIARRIASVRLMVVASPQYLAQNGTPATPSDLVEHQCLIYMGNGEPEWRFRTGKRWTSVRPRGRLRADSGEAIVQGATAGLGLAMLPTFLVSDLIASGALQPLLQDYATPEHGLFIVRPPGARAASKVRALVDMLVDWFGEPH